MPSPVQPPVQDETYCVIVCIPGPMSKEQYKDFNLEVKALAAKYNKGAVIEAKVEQSKKKQK